jgi:hypothetical protein
MHRLYRSFVAHTTRTQGRWIALETQRARLPIWKARDETEALLYDLWQHWCLFARHVILASCGGSKRLSGAPIRARATDNSWQRIGYEAKQAARGQPTRPTGVIASRRQELTWGDPDRLLAIIPALAPNNQAVLLAAFGLSSLRAPKDLQIVRNACAHTNQDTFAEVRGIQIYYRCTTVGHPSDLAWQIESASNDLAFLRWIDDLNLIAQLACA